MRKPTFPEDLPQDGRRCCENCQFFFGVDPDDFPNPQIYRELGIDIAHMQYEIAKDRGGVVVTCLLMKEWSLYGQKCPIVPIVLAHLAEEVGVEGSGGVQ